MDDFGAVNAVYEEFVPEPYPGRSAVEVSDLAKEFATDLEIIAAVSARHRGRTGWAPMSGRRSKGKSRAASVTYLEAGAVGGRR